MGADRDRFHISIQVPVAVEPRARYALQQLSAILGIRFHLVDRDFPHPDAVYGDATQRRSDCSWLPFDSAAYDPGVKHQSHVVEGVKVWGPAASSSQNWDLVGATFRLLTLLDESQIKEEQRDDKGVFRVAGLAPERRQVLAEMLVENHAGILLQLLTGGKPVDKQFVMAPWPAGKRWAFVLSHDTDAITLGSPSEMAFNLVKGVVRADRTSLRMFGQGFRYLRRPNENPLFGFPGWRTLEAPKFRSCFYLFAKPKDLKRHLNDCRSTVVEQKIDWTPLREMAAAGWEFGLHAPIYAKRQADALRWGKQFIEEKIGQPVQGLRHHYWALDWRKPYLTFRKHIEAGFRYDSSIAWRDGMGFRAGTSLPFQPFDPEQQAAMPIYELPTSLMDGHLMDGAAMNGGATTGDSESAGPEQSRRSAAFQLLHEIKARRGMAMLNWHTETACNRYRYQGYVDALGEILQQVASDSEAWITTPGEVVQWWSERQRQLNAQ